jgi:adenylate cyclase
VTAAEQERAFRKNPATLNAFDFDKKGWWHYHRFTMEDNGKARRLFKKAIEMAPGYASAYTGLGFTYYEQWARQWSQDPQSLVQAFTLARKAITLDDSEPGPHALLSHVYLWERKHDQAILEQEKAIALGPNIANSYADLAEILVWAERPEEATPLVEKAMRLNPHFSMNYLFTLGFAYFSTGRYEEAISTCKQALLRDSGHFGFYILMGLSYGELGRAAEARSHVAQALDLNPHLSVDALEQRLPFKDPARFASFAEKLKAAGLK